MTQDDVRMGFLAVQDNAEDGSQVGAILVTDGHTHPIELRYTEPVKVTVLEKISFGLKLREGISISRIAKPLVTDLETNPDVVFVGEEDLIRLENFIDIPVIHISADTEPDPEDPENGGGLAFEELKSQLPGGTDLAEPLQRVKSALDHLY